MDELTIKTYFNIWKVDKVIFKGEGSEILMLTFSCLEGTGKISTSWSKTETTEPPSSAHNFELVIFGKTSAKTLWLNTQPICTKKRNKNNMEWWVLDSDTYHWDRIWQTWDLIMGGCIEIGFGRCGVRSQSDATSQGCDITC